MGEKLENFENISNDVRMLYSRYSFNNGKNINITTERLRVQKEILIIWEQIKNNRLIISETLKISKNKSGQNTFGSPEIVSILIAGHNELSDYSLATLQKRLFTLFRDSSNTTKLFENEIRIVGAKTSYLKIILKTHDLRLKEEYQQIILEYIINQENPESSTYTTLFLMRDNIKEKYKLEVLKRLSEERVGEIRLQLYKISVNDLKEEFKITAKNLCGDITLFLTKLRFKDTTVHRNIESKLKTLKLIEDYIKNT